MLPAFGPLETPRLRMRRYRQDDLALMHEVMSDPSVMRHYPQPFDCEKSQKALSNVLASYEKFGYSLLAVELKAESRFIGHVGLLHWDGVDAREDVEVAYMLLPAYWGHGYATEAAQASKNW
ncbi:MAG: GNAT family N-acetyltransferase, partial [Candidatus Eremiobacteraeota bacterium]|nr:GNAT family N-acetyltransferase [Candidatus Eremiobacteraeota bacterium]